MTCHESLRHPEATNDLTHPSEDKVTIVLGSQDRRVMLNATTKLR